MVCVCRRSGHPSNPGGGCSIRSAPGPGTPHRREKCRSPRCCRRRIRVVWSLWSGCVSASSHAPRRSPRSRWASSRSTWRCPSGFVGRHVIRALFAADLGQWIREQRVSRPDLEFNAVCGDCQTFKFSIWPSGSWLSPNCWAVVARVQIEDAQLAFFGDCQSARRLCNFSKTCGNTLTVYCCARRSSSNSVSSSNAACKVS